MALALQGKRRAINIFELIFYLAIYAASFFVGHHVALIYDSAFFGAFAGFLTVYALLLVSSRLLGDDLHAQEDSSE